MKKNRFTLIDISLFVFLSAILIGDFWLSKFDQGLIFKTKLPSGITIKHDNLQGYEILEEGFIHILNEHTLVEKDTISAFLAYYAEKSDVFVKVETTTDEILYLNIHVLESVNDQIKYHMSKYKSQGNENWINLPNKQSIWLIVIFRNVFLAVTLILFFVKIVALSRRLLIR